MSQESVDTTGVTEANYNISIINYLWNVSCERHETLIAPASAAEPSFTFHKFYNPDFLEILEDKSAMMNLTLNVFCDSLLNTVTVVVSMIVPTEPVSASASHLVADATCWTFYARVENTCAYCNVEAETIINTINTPES